MPRIRALIRLFRLPSSRFARRRRMALLLLLLSTLLLVLLPPYIIYKPPHLLIRYFQHRWPDVLFHVPVPAGEKVIALTIDDAPSPYTEEILKVLAENEAKATIFVIGGQVNGKGARRTLESAVRGGHELANHAMHDEPSRSLTSGELTEQVLHVEGLIKAAYNATGIARPEGRYFRPGSGFFSEKMRNLMAELGWKIVLGGVYPHDAQISWWRLNAWHILSGVRPGSIVVVHDRRGWTVPMLKRVLPELRRRGYEVVTVSELLRRQKKG